MTDPRIEAIAKALFQEIHSGTWVSVGKESHINRYASAIQTLLDDGVIALPDLDGGFYDLADTVSDVLYGAQGAWVVLGLDVVRKTLRERFIEIRAHQQLLFFATYIGPLVIGMARNKIMEMETWQDMADQYILDLKGERDD